jgi:hypothetical protein
MLVVLGVLAAFLTTGAARLLARLDHRAQDFDVRPRAARRDGGGGEADIGAVEIEADALPHILDSGFRKASIGADPASRSTGVTGLDAGYQPGGCTVLEIGMRFDHLAQLHVGLPCVDETMTANEIITRIVPSSIASTR